MSDKITVDELTRLFGDRIPIEVMELVWRAPPERTVGEVRADVIALAQRANSHGGDVIPVAVAAERLAEHMWSEINITGTRGPDTRALVWPNLLRRATQIIRGDG